MFPSASIYSEQTPITISVSNEEMTNWKRAPNVTPKSVVTAGENHSTSEGYR